MGEYELVVGLEVHIQLNTLSKMFCGCGNQAEDAEPNTLVCPVCFGMPGTLPVANKEAIRKALILGTALNAELNPLWNFERKNYFYPDLPKGYQITSSTNPPVKGGTLEAIDPHDTNATTEPVRIHHIHLEEDAGKLIHGKDGYSYVDLNRSGTPLIELVTEPDLRTAHQAKLFLQEMQLMVRALNISEGDMEHGHLRCDANVSVRKPGAGLGTKVEVKNMNSFSMVERAILYEYERQTGLLEDGKTIDQETRSWNETHARTDTMRTKEEVEDYRYLPEPDIPPIVREEVPEFTDNALHTTLLGVDLPNESRQRLMKQYHVSNEQAELLVRDPALLTFFEQVSQVLPKDQNEAKYRDTFRTLLFGLVIRIATEHTIDFAKIALTPSDMTEIVVMASAGDLTPQLFKTTLPDLLSGKLVLREIKEQAKHSAALDINAVIREVLSAHQPAVEQWKAGDHKVYGFLIGQVMAKTKGQADPRKVNEELTQLLKES